MKVTIDPHSGFCFGVVHAIEAAERELKRSPNLFCLGDIVHNNMEVNRLKEMGLIIIDHEELKKLHHCKVLIRAHGEPPETYQTALNNHIELIDASCPIVLRLQNDIRQGYHEMQAGKGQIVIYGREGHAEVNGLKGQTHGTAFVVGNEQDLEGIDFSRPVRLYSQTTKSTEGYRKIVNAIELGMKRSAGSGMPDFIWNDSICRQVSNRYAHLRAFAGEFQAVLFVSDKKSSNGLILYQVCREVNPNTYFVACPEEIRKDWFEGLTRIGVCGGTSTPRWLMEKIAGEIEQMNS